MKNMLFSVKTTDNLSGIRQHNIGGRLIIFGQKQKTGNRKRPIPCYYPFADNGTFSTCRSRSSARFAGLVVDELVFFVVPAVQLTYFLADLL